MQRDGGKVDAHCLDFEVVEKSEDECSEKAESHAGKRSFTGGAAPVQAGKERDRESGKHGANAHPDQDGEHFGGIYGDEH